MKTKAYAALLAGSIIWCLSIIAAPVFGSSWIYGLFAYICHQDPARSLHLFGGPLGVCLRCSSIYFGFAASLCFGLQANVRWLRAAVVVMVVEFAVARLFIDASALRGLSGILLGLSAAPFVRQGVEELSESM